MNIHRNPGVHQILDQLMGVPPTEPVILPEPIAVEDLPTPALVIDLEKFEKNIQKMQNYLNPLGIALRSHAKMHKCPEIARRQIDAGAIGICTATVSEAEVMSRAGIRDILITSPLATKDKLQRLVNLSLGDADVAIVVDCIDGAHLLERAAGEIGSRIGVYLDIDPGLGRTGIQPGQPVLDLYHYIADSCSHLEFRGMQMYAGHCMHINGYTERKEKYKLAMQGGYDTLALFQKAGIEVPVFTGGGTGSYSMENDLSLLNEIQAGSYPFMDVEYLQTGGDKGERFDDFEPALFVIVTAISQPQTQMITVDAGYKAFASDTVKPEFRDIQGVEYFWGGDEHGIVLLNNPSLEMKCGDRFMMITSHCDPTVNLYDYYFPYRNGVVEEIWPISARGRSQ